MAIWLIILLILIAVLISGLIAMLVVTYPISKNVYEEQLVKTSDDKWGRICSAPENSEQLEMWNQGIEWGNAHKEYMKEVSIVSEGLKLFGEYYDFGSDKCVIILPGRCECLVYSYYFAKPYRDAGINVLVIDSRCHGKSEGKYSTIGVKEAIDVGGWMDFLETNFGIKGFWLHGICIGGSAALFIAETEEYSDKVKGIVLEGCFVNFRESFKQHMLEKKKPVFPVLDLVMLNILKYAKANVYRKNPMNSVKNIKNPILFLFGEKDIYSLPEKSRKLFKACSSENKKLVWFDKGSHSHLRINNTEKYDGVIKDFIEVYEKR